MVSVRRATLLSVRWQVMCCSSSYLLGLQRVCMLPASGAVNAARLHVFLGTESVWDGIILGTRSWLLSFPWAPLPLLHHKLYVHLLYDREPGTGSCCYQSTTPGLQLMFAGNECHQELSELSRLGEHSLETEN